MSPTGLIAKLLSLLVLSLSGLVSAQAGIEAGPEAEGLPRVVSLDYCADQYVLAVADPSQILALSPEADHIHSFYRQRAEGLPQVRADAESVLALRPDVALRNWGGDPRMIALLERAGIKVLTADYGSGPQVMFDNLSRFAAAMNRSEAAEALIAQTRAALDAAQGSRTGLTAAYVAPGGITAGTGTFVDEIIVAVGFRSSAAQLGLAGWRPLPLEALVRDPPDVIVASFFDLKQARASNWSIARHARVRQILETTPTLYVPGRYFSCNGLFFADTVSFIRSAARDAGLLDAATGEAQP